MDSVARLGGAVATVERLLAQKTGVRPSPHFADQHRRDVVLECRTVAYMRAVGDDPHKDEKMMRNTLFGCATVGTVCLSVEWDVATINVQEKNSLLFHIKEGIKTIDLRALKGRSGAKEDAHKPVCTIEEKSFSKTIDTTTSTADHTGNLSCTECKKAKESVVALFQIEAQKKLATLGKITEDTEEDLRSKENQNRGMFSEFKNLIRQNTESGSTIFEPLSLGASPGVKGGVPDSGALAKLVESPSFEKYLDRQIVATILRGEVFRKHLLRVLEADDIEEIVRTHVPCVTSCLAELFQESAPDERADYERLWGALDERYRRSGVSDKSMDAMDDKSVNPTGDLNAIGDKSVSIIKFENATSSENRNGSAKELEEYRCIFEEIMKRVNKGNFECDSRFLRIIGRTISKIGVYDDPVLCKMTVQFVLCKRYVEDFVGIKRALKRFARCDI